MQHTWDRSEMHSKTFQSDDPMCTDHLGNQCINSRIFFFFSFSFFSLLLLHNVSTLCELRPLSVAPSSFLLFNILSNLFPYWPWSPSWAFLFYFQVQNLLWDTLPFSIHTIFTVIIPHLIPCTPAVGLPPSQAIFSKTWMLAVLHGK